MDSLFIEPPQLGPFGKTDRHVVRIQHQGVRYVLANLVVAKRPSNSPTKTSTQSRDGPS